MIPEITVKELQRELASATPPIVIDVREDDEVAISRLPAYVHIPMMEVPTRLEGLDREADYVILCHTGRRSARVTAFMRQNGFSRVRNVEGGIDRWSSEVDPTVPHY